MAALSGGSVGATPQAVATIALKSMRLLEGGRHQVPVPVHLLEPMQPETIQPSGSLDRTEHGLHDRDRSALRSMRVTANELEPGG